LCGSSESRSSRGRRTDENGLARLNSQKYGRGGIRDGRNEQGRLHGLSFFTTGISSLALLLIALPFFSPTAALVTQTVFYYTLQSFSIFIIVYYVVLLLLLF
jgi:hypothetical protein